LSCNGAVDCDRHRYALVHNVKLQLRILVEDLKAFEDFLRHKLTRIRSVAQITTSFALWLEDGFISRATDSLKQLSIALLCHAP
jgi:DNA-binding Lrp family transcriptional regulator